MNYAIGWYKKTDRECCGKDSYRFTDYHACALLVQDLNQTDPHFLYYVIKKPETNENKN